MSTPRRVRSVRDAAFVLSVVLWVPAHAAPLSAPGRALATQTAVAQEDSPPARPPVPEGLAHWDEATRCWSERRNLPPATATPPGQVEPGERTGTWTFAANVRAHPETTGQHLWPDIAVAPDGTVGAAWMDDHAAGGFHIFYTSSSDGGATWSAPERVDDRTAGSYSKFVSIAFTPSSGALAVWEDDRSGAINVYFSKRSSSGTWSQNVRVNTAGSPPDGSYFMNPSIAAVDDSRCFVAWTDWREGTFYQVYMRGTRDGGLSWGGETRISDEIGYQPVAGDPCLIADPDSGPPGAEILYCVMDDWRGYAPAGRFPDVYFSRSTNGGAFWSDGLPVNDITDYFQQTSSRALVRLADGTLSTGWLSGDFSSSSFRTCVSTDRGATWSASARVDDPALGGTGTWSSISSWGNAVFAGFDCYQGNWNSYFRPSADGGRSWTDPVARMDDDTSGAATGNTVLVATGSASVVGAWQDTRPGYGPWLIYTSRGTGDVTGVDGGSPVPPRSAAPLVLCVPNPSRAGEPLHLLLSGGDGEAAALPGSAGPRPQITIHDAAGRCLRVLRAEGEEAVWDGRDAGGIELPAGVYWVRALPGAEARIVRVR